MQQNLFHNFFQREIGALKRNIDLEQQKQRPK